MKKLKLQIEQTYDIEVYGVSTALKGYKLCWHIDQALSIDLKRLNKIELPASTKTDFEFYQTENDEQEYCFVLKNENRGSYYLPKYKVADFFVVKFCDSYVEPLDNVKQALQSIAGVQAVFPIDISKPKDAEAFIVGDV